jgi:hypothetical protein
MNQGVQMKTQMEQKWRMKKFGINIKYTNVFYAKLNIFLLFLQIEGKGIKY